MRTDPGPLPASPTTRRRCGQHSRVVDAALRGMRQLSRAAIDTAADGILTIDERGTIETLNPAAERLFGWSSAELLGRNVTEIMPAPDAEEHDEYLAHYLRTRERASSASGVR